MLFRSTYKYVTALKANILYGTFFYGDAALDVKLPGLTGAYQFFKTASSEYTQEGIGFTIPGLNIPTPISYTEPDVVYHFPLTFRDKDSASFSGSATLAAGFSITISGKRINIVDGWGKVITPYKTYNCIRMISIVNEVDSFLGIGIDNSRIEYKWLSTSEQIPVFEAVVPAGALGGGMTLYYRDSYKNIVNPNGPVVDFDVADTNVLTGIAVTFNNNTTGALSYSWVITPSSYTYTGATSGTSKNPQVIFNKRGLYTVSLNATGIGGSNYLTKFNYINVTHNTGIESVNNGIRELQLYPNPASGDVFINTGSGLSENSLYSIIDASGRIVYSGTIATADGQSHLSLKDCTPGLYLVRVQNGKQVFEGRVVKE